MGTKVIKSSQLTKWHKLDNSAKIFPAASSVTTGNVFRLSCVLNKTINPVLLQQALTSIIGFFPAFNVRLRAGFFWYYFENNSHSPLVTHEDMYPCAPMNRRENDGFMFRVLYHENRLALEIYHALTDGTGGIEFLRALITTYLGLENPSLSPQNIGVGEGTAPNAAVIEDGYGKIYEKTHGLPPFAKRAFRIRGTRLPFTAIKVLHGTMSTAALLATAREKGVTITALLSAILVYSIYTEELNSKPTTAPVEISLPVNLRTVFGTKTALNFFECIGVGVIFDRDDYTFDEILSTVSRRLSKELLRENLSAKNAYKVRMSRIFALRIIPLFIKNMILRTAYKQGELTATTAISNLGRIEIAEEFRPYIDHFEVLLPPTESNYLKCAVCSFGDKLVISFISSIEQDNIQKAFFRNLVAMSIAVTLEANYLNEPKPNLQKAAAKGKAK